VTDEFTFKPYEGGELGGIEFDLDGTAWMLSLETVQRSFDVPIPGSKIISYLSCLCLRNTLVLFHE
jgi:hypothetical protein